jgi:glycosyltransferase involved in cell wall biosynthesis
VSPELAEPSTARPRALGGYDDAVAIGISVVMPCLNEEDSVGICVRKAWEGIRLSGMDGEVIVADNGSTDRSVAEARAAGARVVYQPRRGYGNAYLKGFDVARGRIIVMGDSDDSYDFTKIPDLIKPIEDGYEYVLGSRFAGHIQPDAMPWSHRRIGNPALTAILNILFGLKVSDAHSGYRALTRTAIDKMGLRCEGMEFASEIVVKAAQANLRTAEVPITYHPRIGVSKLQSLRDAWRHVRFLLLLSPDHLFVFPGMLFTALGFVGQLFMLGLRGSPYVLFAKILLALVTLGGSQLLTLGLFAKVDRPDPDRGRGRSVADRVAKAFTLERGVVIGGAFALVGVVLAAMAFLGASRGLVAAGGFVSSVAVLGLLLIVLGGKLCFDAFFLSMILLRRPVPADPYSPVAGETDAEAGSNEQGTLGALKVGVAELRSQS